MVWNSLGTIRFDINGEAHNDKFGYSVSMNANGNRVAIGAKIMMVMVLILVMLGYMNGQYIMGTIRTRYYCSL